MLQGGGALGAYQAGVYQGLHEAGIRPNWVAGISIGSINAAIIAGSPEDERVARLRGFWETICRPTGFAALPLGRYAGRHVRGHSVRLRLAGHERPAVRLPCAGVRSAWFLQAALSAALPVAWAGAASTSFYDTSALADTLRQFVDFDLLNAGKVRASFGVVNVRTGNFAYFDSRKDRLGPEHVMASGALPPGFPSVEIDGEHYWDGGVVSNTPLAQVVGAENMRDTLAFQVDLWPARGGLPTSLEEVAERQKDIQYSSRTRLVTDQLRRVLKLRHGLQKLLARLPESEARRPGRAAPAVAHAGDQHRQPDLRVQAPRALFRTTSSAPRPCASTGSPACRTSA